MPSAHVTEQTSPTAVRNLLIAGLLGLIGGIVAAFGLASRRREPVALHEPVALQEVGSIDQLQLKARVEALTRRELALARQAGELAQRESRLERGEVKLAQRESRLTRRVVELAAASREVPVPRAEPLPPRQPELADTDETMPGPLPASGATSAPGTINLEQLQGLVAQRQGEFPDRASEWETYLFYLRDHADARGQLPRQFVGLISDVFGPLLD